MIRWWWLLWWLAGPCWAQVDAAHAGWDALVHKHVRWQAKGTQSRVDYDGLQADRAALSAVLAQYSALTQAQFDALGREQQMAWLINAYNAFTVELVLTLWPDLKSIKDLGGVFSSPWRKAFFTLLGQRRTLDWIEHEQLRPRYRDARVHAALNCASIGCPALRNEAFTAARLDAQLDDGMRRFMSDHTRNRVRDGQLEVSMIFKWFAEDFEGGHYKSALDLYADYAAQLSDDPAAQQRLRAQQLRPSYLDYDWSLNALGR